MKNIIAGALVAGALIAGKSMSWIAGQTTGGMISRRVQPPPVALASPTATLPTEKLNVFLDAFHVRDGRPAEQLEVAHYCSSVSPDLYQCALFSGRETKSKLVGIEYVITPEGLGALSRAERALWHSHAYEVTSGQLVGPSMASDEEHALMETLVRTYGKAWHTWSTDRGDALPVGRPSLMMSFTADGQLRPELLRTRDATLGISTEDVKRGRQDIEAPILLSGVDQGENGTSCVPAARPVLP